MNAAPCHLHIFVYPSVNINVNLTENWTTRQSRRKEEREKALSLTFKKMVQTSIPGYLKLGPNAHRGPARSGDDDALQDTFHISLFDTHNTYTYTQARAEKSEANPFSQFMPARESGQAHLEVHRPLIQRAILYDKENAREVGVEEEGTLPSESDGGAGMWGHEGQVPVRML